MRVVIKGPRRDLFSFFGHIMERGNRIRRSTARPPREGTVSAVAKALHPGSQKLIVTSASTLGSDGMLYTLAPAEPGGRIVPFRSGSYITVSLRDEGGRRISRPYSICSTPSESRRTNSYIIAVRTGDGSFFADRIREEWNSGTSVSCSAPEGFFTYEPLRDGTDLVFIAGGSGITPFRSLAGDILENHPATTVALLHGAKTPWDLYFSADFRNLMDVYPDRFTWKPVISESVDDNANESANGVSFSCGFIDAPLIDEAAAGRKSTIFVCGPPGLHRHVDRELENVTFTIHRRRSEDYGFSGKPSGNPVFRLEARMDGRVHQLTADPGETVLVALERGGLSPPSGCRNGTCGFCRSRLLEGTVIQVNENNGLRQADRERNFFHPCVSIPGSDMIIEVPVDSGENGNAGND